MEYTVIKENEDGTALVRMTIDGHVLEQAFSPENLDEDVKLGMAVFKSELDRNLAPEIDITPLIGKVEIVEELPELPAVEIIEEVAPEPLPFDEPEEEHEQEDVEVVEEVIEETPVEEPVGVPTDEVAPEQPQDEPIIEPEEA